MDRAALIGVPEGDFWEMTLAQFRRLEKAWADRREGEYFDMLNAFGSVWHGKDWKWQKPGPQKNDHVERIKAAMAALEERRKNRNG